MLLTHKFTFLERTLTVECRTVSGVYKIETEPELKDKVSQLLEECRNNWILAANPGMTNTAPVLAGVCCTLRACSCL